MLDDKSTVFNYLSGMANQVRHITNGLRAVVQSKGSLHAFLEKHQVFETRAMRMNFLGCFIFLAPSRAGMLGALPGAGW